MHRVVYGGGRGGGKAAAMWQAIADYLKANPTATIVRFESGETRVEKHVDGEQVEEKPLCLPPA